MSSSFPPPDRDIPIVTTVSCISIAEGMKCFDSRRNGGWRKESVNNRSMMGVSNGDVKELNSRGQRRIT